MKSVRKVWVEGFLYVASTFLITVLAKGAERPAFFSMPWQVWVAAIIQGMLALKAFLSNSKAAESLQPTARTPEVNS